MKNNFKFNPQTLIVISFIILASLSRFIPHIHNFSPIGAISLFGAAFFKSKWKAFLVPISATWISDLFLNNIGTIAGTKTNNSETTHNIVLSIFRTCF